MKTLILGIGNFFLGDEGLGAHAARKLIKEELPRETKVLEVETSILDTLADLENADRVILLDAIKADGEPGTVYRLCIERCESPNDIAAMHSLDIFAVLALSGRNKPGEVVALGIEPAKQDWTAHLSKEVSQALPFLVDSVKRELNGEQPYFQL
jgi:hydrogenase maturation protease